MVKPVISTLLPDLWNRGSLTTDKSVLHRERTSPAWWNCGDDYRIPAGAV